MQRKSLLIASGFVIGILIFTIVAQGSEPEWRPLAEYRKNSVLTEITECLGKLQSVGVSFEWKDGKLNKNGTEEITGEYNYFEVFDDHRHYLKQSLKQISGPNGTMNSEESKFIPIVERSWNGSLMRDYDHRSGTGEVRGKVRYFTPAEVMAFSVIGRDHSGRSWIKRYQNRDVTEIDYDVEIDAENENLIKVTEQPKNLTSIYARQTFIFDRAKNLAITRCYLENVYQDEDKIHRLSDIRFGDFKQVDGFHIPFKISRIAKATHINFTGVQYITVKEVTVNDNSHEKFLRNFTFPRNTNIYDYILDMPIHIGVDTDEQWQEIREEARKRADRDAEDKRARDALIGKPAPEFNFQRVLTPNKDTLSIKEFEGKVLLLDFWGVWCSPCIKSLPKLHKIYDTYRNKGFIILGVHSSYNCDELDAFLQKHTIIYPVAVASEEMQKDYGITAWPTYILVDRQGKIITVNTGALPKDKQIEEVLQGHSSKAVTKSPDLP